MYTSPAKAVIPLQRRTSAANQVNAISSRGTFQTRRGKERSSRTQMENARIVLQYLLHQNTYVLIQKTVQGTQLGHAYFRITDKLIAQAWSAIISIARQLPMSKQSFYLPISTDLGTYISYLSQSFSFPFVFVCFPGSCTIIGYFIPLRQLQRLQCK